MNFSRYYRGAFDPNILLCKYVKKMWMINTASFAVYLVVRFLERSTVATTLFGNPLRYLLWFVFGMNLNKYGKVAKNYLNRFKWGGYCFWQSFGSLAIMG